MLDESKINWMQISRLAFLECEETHVCSGGCASVINKKELHIVWKKNSSSLYHQCISCFKKKIKRERDISNIIQEICKNNIELIEIIEKKDNPKISRYKFMNKE